MVSNQSYLSHQEVCESTWADPGAIGHNERCSWRDPVPRCSPTEGTDGSSGFIRLPWWKSIESCPSWVRLMIVLLCLAERSHGNPEKTEQQALVRARKRTRSHRAVMIHAASSCWLRGCSWRGFACLCNIASLLCPSVASMSLPDFLSVNVGNFHDTVLLFKLLKSCI